MDEKTDIALCDSKPAGEPVAYCAVVLPEGEPPEWVQLMTPGSLTPSDGRPAWTLNDAAAVISASRVSGRDLVVDFEHQTDLAAKNGQPAPAAGWMKELQARADGIWARVEWTAEAAAMIAAKKYRYISPTFLHEKASRRVTRILRAGLTNNPALELTALASVQTGDNSMDEFLKALCAALGLAEGTDKEKVLAKAAEIVAQATATAKAQAVVTAICTALKIDPPKDGTDVAKAIGDKVAELQTATAKAGDGEPDPTKFVPKAMFDELSARVGNMEKSSTEEKATAAVDQATQDGKVSPAMKNWALSLATKDMAAFEQFVANAPVIVKPGSVVPKGQPTKTGGSLEPDELAACRAMGIDPEEFKKTRDAETEENA